MADRLAGYDLVLELSRDVLRNLLLQRPELAEYRPPFEYEVDIGGGGRAYFVFDDLDVFLLPGNVVRIRLPFDRSSVLGSSVLRAAGHFADGNAFDLIGTLDMDVAIELAPGAANPMNRDFVFHLEQAVVTSTIRRAANDTRNYGIIEGAMKDKVEPQLRDRGAIRLALPIRVDPTSPGLDPLVVQALTLATIAPPEPERQSLALFARLIDANAPDVSVRTASSIPPGRHGVFAISPQAFHAFSFTPVIARMLTPASGVAPMRSQLPPTVGTATEAAYPALPQWFLTRVADTFRSGYIEVDVQAQSPNAEGALGSTLHVHVLGKIVPTLVNGQVSAEWKTIRAGAGEDFAWGWWVGSIIFPGMLITMGVAHFGSNALVGANTKLFTVQIGATPLTVPFGELTMADVSVTPQELALSGTVVPRARDLPVMQAHLDATITFEDQQISEGVYESHSLVEGRYRYQRYVQRERVTFQVTPVFAARPLTYHWTVTGFEPPEAVAGQGTTLISVETLSGTPPQQRATRGDVAIDYEVSADGGTLVLRNRPDDGNYQVNVSCEVVDHEGRRTVLYGAAEVEGDKIEMLDGFNEDFERAIEGLADAFHRYRERMNRLPHRLPRRGEVIRRPMDAASFLAVVAAHPHLASRLLADTALVGWRLDLGSVEPTRLVTVAQHAMKALRGPKAHPPPVRK